MLIKKEDLFPFFSFVLDRIYSEKYTALNEAINVETIKLKEKVYYIIDSLKTNPYDAVLIDSAYTPEKLRRRWGVFDKNFSGVITDVYKINYNKLIEEFYFLLEQVKNSCIKSFQKQEVSTKTIDKNELEEDIKNLLKKRERLRNDIEQENHNPHKDEDKVIYLKTQYDRIDSEYQAALEAKKKLNVDNLVEQNISEKVTKAFDSLKDYTQLIEEERIRLKWEYYTALVCIAFLVFGFIIIYVIFICVWSTNRENFSKFIDLLPYTSSIPLFGVLIWLCVYLKDRATKISIELSTRLFNIHYLEGLMKLTNSLSISPDEAIRKIDNATGLLIKNYLSQVKDNHITEGEVSKIELSELKSNPYWKILQELKELIKLIKQ